MLTFKQFLLENIEEDTTLEYNDTLNQKLFDENDHLKPEVRDVLLKFAYKWVEFVKIIPQNIIVDIMELVQTLIIIIHNFRILMCIL